MAEGAFRPLDPVEAATVTLALLDGLSLQLTFEDGGGPDDRRPTTSARSGAGRPRPAGSPRRSSRAT
jgi:hypothetical protein